MNCKKVQESILTDYVDGQLEDKQIWLVEQHLAHCPVCGDFLGEIKKEVIDPFINLPKALPDKLLWTRIKQAIEEDQEQQIEKILIPGFWQRLRSAVHIPRPAFALTTVLAMIFMIGPTGQLFINSRFVKINGPDQIEYLSSLIDEPVEIDANNVSDPQTPMEKYFL